MRPRKPDLIVPGCGPLAATHFSLDPSRRATAKEALGHGWLERGEAVEMRTDAADSLQRHSLVLRSLQDFASMEALHKVALEVVAFTAPPSTFDELRKLFKTIDVDNSGTISFDEFKEAMSNYPEIPEAQVRRLGGEQMWRVCQQ